MSRIRFRKKLTQDSIVSDRTRIPTQVYLVSNSSCSYVMHIKSENVGTEGS